MTVADQRDTDPDGRATPPPRIRVEQTAAGAIVRKRLTGGDPGIAERFANEALVNRELLCGFRGFSFAPLINAATTADELVFERMAGVPVAHDRYPTALAAGVPVSAIIDVCELLAASGPSLSRRLPLDARLARLMDENCLPRSWAASLSEALTAGAWSFAHGDLLMSNLLWDGTRLTVLDFEFAAMQPSGSDLAFVWLLLGRVEGARAAISAHVERWAPVPRRALWAGAALVAAHEIRLHRRDGDHTTVMPLLMISRNQAWAQLQGTDHA